MRNPPEILETMLGIPMAVLCLVAMIAFCFAIPVIAAAQAVHECFIEFVLEPHRFRKALARYARDPRYRAEINALRMPGESGEQVIAQTFHLGQVLRTVRRGRWRPHPASFHKEEKS